MALTLPFARRTSLRPDPLRWPWRTCTRSTGERKRSSKSFVSTSIKFGRLAAGNGARSVFAFRSAPRRGRGVFFPGRFVVARQKLIFLDGRSHTSLRSLAPFAALNTPQATPPDRPSQGDSIRQRHFHLHGRAVFNAFGKDEIKAVRTYILGNRQCFPALSANFPANDDRRLKLEP